jgi:predicted TPR repeat methyltransferase
MTDAVLPITAASPATSRTSGDILADRRFAYAQALAREGDHAAAADLLEQTLERVPGWVPAWIALGVAREQQSLREAALDAFARAEPLDTTGIHGAGLHAARLRGGVAQPVMPRAYVAALFDDYAARFDAHLVGTLGYRGPALVAESLDEAVGSRRFARAVDLGCGTGLMAPPIRARVDHLCGVDLSPAMVAEAEKRGLYDELVAGDILEFLDGLDGGSIDLALAADVFAYLGPLGPVATALARVLRPGGIAAFTLQHDGGTDIRLGPDMRFSHSERHVWEALAGAGLDIRVLRQASSRRDAGADVPGLVVVAGKP